jgi:hypothetical protein
MFEYVLLCAAICDYVLLQVCSTMYGHALTMCCYVWLSVTMCQYLLVCAAMCEHLLILVCAKLCGHVLVFAALCGYL